ncbi:AbrB family transcriptional regulator (stage V sporulation protein T) [Sporomusaceae bacterium BoRhaA]|uniref:stage V sporulation protein T n=1 Tax=Pelorhabdus rhamnosifermentans TaxID=2772457 RepID=UPI0028A8BA7F|nr:stage V sporulation protein T [Pelorhabdus rhamnosifermentans]MBU2700691.1 AbrB family transcriptional regulator (stage V sporulation protein T) [Pelorhabdus rhamnosifermentans]
MKATGIVRRIDDLGRVVIPKEIRRTLRIREGDPLEIYVDHEGEVILKKYSPVGQLGDFAKEYADSLHEAIAHIVLVADRDNIVAVAGASKKEFLNKPLGPAVEQAMEGRKTVIISNPSEYKDCKGCVADCDDEGDGICKFTAEVIAPIVVEGDAIGAVMICSKQPGAQLGEMENKLAETAAGFLAKQMS